MWFSATSPLNAQDREQSEDEKVYKTTWADGVVTAAGIGVSYWGLSIMKDKEPLPDEYLMWVANNPEAAREHIPRIDRWVAGNYSKTASEYSNYPFYGSFALPLLYLADERTRSDFGQIGLLYLETMSITGSLFSQVAGRTFRNRPLVYNADPDNDDRSDRKAENSFFGGHTVATASATFFAAKVFNDYFPNSRAKPFVWAGAALIPATVGYLRLRAGKHFLTDNLLGYGIGAGVGILVPHLHKISKKKNYTLLPVTGYYDGFVFKYQF